MVNNINKMFSSTEGGAVYECALRTVEENNMHPLIESGVLVGFSGGADSVMLLSFLVKFRAQTRNFPILAVHVNHGIRGEEADRDERFSRDFATLLGVEFKSVFVDVPTLASESGCGLEEAARNARYSIFNEIILGRNDINAVAVAHNATDNLETVIINMMRGAGTKGMAGIKAVRDKVIRPLIGISKKDILSILAQNNIPYVTDSTNLSSDYTRNYVRREILPMLSRLSDSPEKMAMRMCKNLLCDDEYIDSRAKDFLADRNVVPARELQGIHPALFTRVVALMCKNVAAFGVEAVHFEKIRELLEKNNFSVSLPGDYSFVCEYGSCRIAKEAETEIFSNPLALGENSFDNLGFAVYITEEPIDKTYTNVYKNSIQVCVSSDIIDNGVYIRSKADGDFYRYGGATRKLKKLFNDRKIPPARRNKIPIFCDNNGIFWVPGFGLRDDVKPKNKKLYITVLEK